MLSTPLASAPVAVIDIGSNAVRLVIFDGLNRAPVRLHTERTICGLGKGLQKTKKLNPEGVEKALVTLKRYATLLEAMDIKNVRAVATAAVRDAEDGAKFIATVDKKYGIRIDIISGEDEARLSALGVMGNGLGSDGLIGDFGGGSLEIVAAENNKIMHQTTLPVGALRILSFEHKHERAAYIDGYLDGIPFLKDYVGEDFYALGGAWRSIAKVHIEMTNHPIHVLDSYAIDGDTAHELIQKITKHNLKTLCRMTGMNERKAEDVSAAAMVMERLFARIEPSRVIFTGTGLREGLLFDSMPRHIMQDDPLISACEKIAMTVSRFSDLSSFPYLMKWLQPLFPNESSEMKRYRMASCYLSDFAWSEHEDFQADHSFGRILAWPFYGLDHPGRAFIALCIYARYKSRIPERVALFEKVKHLLSPAEEKTALILGLALRLAYVMTGGALGLLKKSSLTLKGKELHISFGRDAGIFGGEEIEKTLFALENALGKKIIIT
jgi:exopolyphosphatase/guanosine-5'-triphosphate,3'-diphosphate pyrophosphatase